MSFNETLKKARKAKGLTQDDVAQALGAKNTTISNWENGVSRPDVDTLVLLCRLYEISPNDILEYYNDELSDAEQRYYLDPEAAEIAQEVQHRPELKALIEASRKVSATDLELVINMMDRLKMYQTKFEKFRQTNGAEDTAECNSSYEAETIAAHHEGDWAKEGLEEVEESEKYVRESDYADAKQIAVEIKKEKECVDDISGL